MRAALLCCAAGGWGAAGLLRQELFKQKENPLAEGAAYPEQWYNEQTLDHFTAGDSRTFSQRFFANFDHYKPGGPIILNIGGEGPLSPKYISGYFATEAFAEELGGATVAVEHRFYGKTQPFDSLATEHLKYLTSRQALHDLAQFQKWFAANRSLDQSTFFCTGGSYPGNLAAWYRFEFPNMTAGCWAASAPVEAVEDWPQFGAKVWEAVATDTRSQLDNNVSAKLYAGYEQIAGLIQDPTPQASAWLREAFNVCPGTLVSQQDRDNMEAMISTAPGFVMQYNNTKTPKLADIRDIVIRSRTPLDAALNVSRFLNLTEGADPGSCTDNSVGAFYAQLANATLPSDGSGNAGRAWTWQTCNEFGYFQTARSLVTAATPNPAFVPTMYTRGVSSTALWQQACEQVFEIKDEEVGARIAATNAYYGAKDPWGRSQDFSHVFFTNGHLDAWSMLGVTPEGSPIPSGREVFAAYAPLGSHCVGLYSTQTDGGFSEAVPIRARALELFKRWGGL